MDNKKSTRQLLLGSDVSFQHMQKCLLFLSVSFKAPVSKVIGISLLWILFWFVDFQHIAAQPSEIKSHLLALSASKKTRVIVVGISDYQDNNIRDLQFAHRDAIAISEYFRSPSGGGLSPDQLVILTDSIATQARFAMAIDWLINVSNPGDQAILYFAGHGAIQQNRKLKPAYLLFCDAHYPLFSSGGAISMIELEHQLEELRVKSVKTTVILDACHSGKLAYSNEQGINLANLLGAGSSSVTKVLSCQKNELSNEGLQWGGGHGAFSYHLLRGLYGLADKNEDLIITFGEIEEHLRNSVPHETAPIQTPRIISEDINELFASVDEATLGMVKRDWQGKIPRFAPVEHRSFEEIYIAEKDSTFRELFFKYKKAIHEGRLLGPKQDCADTYFISLVKQCEGDNRLRQYLTHHFAASLQDDAQKGLLSILNLKISSGPEVRELILKHKDAPSLIARAAEVVGSRHFMHKELLSRELFFKGFLLFGKSIGSQDTIIAKEILTIFNEALHLNKNTPAAHYYMALTYLTRLRQIEPALHHIDEAKELAYNWPLPMAHAASIVAKKPFENYILAGNLLDQARDLDSTSVLVWTGYGTLYATQRRFQEAEQSLRRALAIDSTNALAWTNLAAVIMKPGRYEEVEELLDVAQRIRPDIAHLWYVRACLYRVTKRIEQAEECYIKSITINPNLRASRDSLIVLYIQQQRLEDARLHIGMILEKDKNDVEAHYHLALIDVAEGNMESAKNNLEWCVSHQMKNPERIQHDPLFQFLRESEGYMLWMEKLNLSLE